MDMSMTPSMSSTTSTPAPTASSMGGMGMGSGSSCKISMLWNWYTVDACFLSSTWHIRSGGAFAGSCIGVIFLVMSLEFLRRAQREFDRYLMRRNVALLSRCNTTHGIDDNSDGGQGNGNPSISIRPARNFDYKAQLQLRQHLVRSFLYMMQFAVGYFVMLLAMYYNGYIILMIFVGAFLGALVFQWDTFSAYLSVEPKEACC